MGARMRAFDWASTPVGAVEQWPQSLKTSVSTCLNSRFAILIWWGRDLVKFYNDAYSEILGNKHPAALGARGRDVWPEIWHIIGPMLDGVLERGEATWSDDLLLELNRNGYPEECYFTFSYSPIRDESGGVGGVFTPVQETTGRVIGERRLRTLRDLAASATAANTHGVEEVARVAMETLSRNPFDIPFAMLYLLSNDGSQAMLAGTAGVEAGSALAPENANGWLSTIGLSTIPANISSVPSGAWPVPPNEVLVLPLSPSGQRVGFLVVAVSPRKRLDQAYRDFLTLVAGHVTTALAEARAFQEERRRAEALAELDRAKTQFFSNVSHEFRTPLTLLLGPLSDVLRDNPTLPPSVRESMEAAQRNGLRLLRLVNSLLDFSRIEAGRARVAFAPTDLAVLTTDLAGTFRSAMERAGLRFIVDCSPLPEPVWVDREMWEKIVLNLLSNAFKFTLHGHIAVRLRAVDGFVELSVEDTGTGIPEAELPRVFERFHRVEGVRGRTFEGTGIGLALVRELAWLHGGNVSVESKVGQGSTFLVSVPLGNAHVRQEQLDAATGPTAVADRAEAFVAEALGWLPEVIKDAEESEPAAQLGSPSAKERVLVVDDNADMRAYMHRLLAGRYEVVQATDGEQAIASVTNARPDLVLSDIMMPGMDGFGLLGTLRSNPETRTIPVILISARAGEDARSEGMDAGADDYLAKPFSSQELVARVGAHLKLARLRRQAEEQASNILESITDGFAALDANWRVVYLNTPGERILGRVRGEVLGHTWWDQCPHTMGTAVEQELRRALHTRMTAEFASSHDGQSLTWRAYPTRDGGLSLYFCDVTEQERVRDALRLRDAELAVERDRLAAVFAQSPAFMVVLRGPDHVVERANNAYIQLVGHRDLVGRRLFEALPEIREQGYCELLDEVLATGKPYVGTSAPAVLQREPDGPLEDRFVDFVYAPLTEADGSRSGVMVIGYDVTERVKADMELRRSRAELASVFEAAPVGIAMVDCDLRFVQINDELARLDGRSAEEHIGRTVRDVLGPAAAELIEPVFRKVTVTGEPVRNWEISGPRRTYLAQCVPVRAAEGNVSGACSVVLDITDRKRAEEALRRSESHFREIADSLPQLVWVTGPDGRHAWYNRRWYEYTGSTFDQCSGEQWADFFHPDDVAEAEARWGRSLATGEPFEMEYRCRRRDGAWRWMLGRAEPLRDVHGDIQQWFGSWTDIEDQKKAEEQLRGQQRWLETLLNQLPTPVVLVEPGTAKVLFSNRAADELSGGWFPKEIPTDCEPPYRVYDADGMLLGKGELPRARLARGEELHGLEVDFEMPGVRRSLLVQGALIPAMHGHESVGVAVFQDVSRLKAVERALRRSNDDLQQFAYVASHDLQEPLRTVTSFSQLLDRSSHLLLDEESRSYLGYVVSAAKRMSALIQDLLTYSRITSDKDRAFEMVDMNDVLESVLGGLEISIRESGAVIQAGELPVVVGDRFQLQQVFQNLISNSLKYSREDVKPEVQVGYALEGAHWRLWVRDNGQGFAPEYANQVFGIFKRLHGGQVPGTGIGLAIVKTVVERHGGQVWAESVVGEGSTFHVLLPRKGIM